ncbi:MAG: hypothetical protein EA378_05125 [Phycisphaerales bacterium]|nr:MAG: hypothetical protein EA378_05125 [Phycisphaerales bacterium]
MFRIPSPRPGARREAQHVQDAPRPGVSRRRGTFLILVVAILAFLALLTIAYLALGRADERSSTTLRQSDRVQSVEQSVAEYIAQVIADDAVSTADMGFGFEVQNNRLVPRLRHLAAWDYPSIDNRYRSNISEPSLPPNAANARAPFDPVGTFGDDPWLASTEPTFLWKANGTPFYPGSGSRGPSNAVRPQIPSDALGTGLLPHEFAFLRTDWAMISNVAPDGRFINKFNLRNNFEAEPGVALGRMSYGLTHPGEPNTLITNAATLNNPAIFTANQYNAYRPLDLDDPFGPDNPRYFAYQWADADGDGFADSRWFELTDWSRGDSNSAGRLPSGTRFRWIAAVRVVDLSAMVNVNTATSLRGNIASTQDEDIAPTRQHPVGATPADVDLRRILSHLDLIDQGGDATPFTRRMLPQNFARPNSQASVSALNSLTSDLLFELGDRAYESLRLRLLPPAAGDLGPSYENILDYTPPATPAIVYDYTPVERAFSFDFFALGNQADRFQGGYRTRDGIGTESLAELLTFRTANDPATFSSLESALSVATRRDGGPFRSLGGGQGGQNPPRTAYYHPLRSQRPLSLERLGNNNNDTPGDDFRFTDQSAVAQSFGDIRQRLTTLSGARPLRSRPNSGGSISGADVRINATSIMRNLESNNAASRDAAVQTLFSLYADALMPYSDRTLGQVRFSNGGQADFREVWAWNGGNNDEFNRLRTLFYGHRGPEFALLTAAHAAVNMADLLDSNAPGSTAEPITSRTVLADGSMAGNSLKRDLIQDLNSDINARRQRWAYVSDSNGSYSVFDLDGQGATQAERLADTADGDVLRGSPAHNVYGIEPTPVITELASFHIYTDAHERAGGDGENEEWEDITPADPPGQPPVYRWIRGGPTIDGRVTDGNSDFVAQVVVVQLHNPFDAAVPLVATTSDGVAVPRFYIQFGERPPSGLGDGSSASPRFFPLAGLSDEDWNNNFTTVPWSGLSAPLAPGETRNVVLVTESLSTIDSRIRNLAQADGSPLSSDGSPFINWLTSQLSITQTLEGAEVTRAPTVVAEFNPEQPDPAGAGITTLRTPANIDLLSAIDDRARVGQALLWRAVYTPGETATQALIDNDQLVDRIRDPNLRYGQPFEPTLDGRLPSDFFVNSTNSQAGPDASESGGPEGDNTGFSVTMWASIRRPSTNLPSVETAAFPSWMFEFKRTGADVDRTANSTRRLTESQINDREAFIRNPTFLPQPEGTHFSFTDLLARQGAIELLDPVGPEGEPNGGGSTDPVRLLPTLRELPRAKTGNDIGVNPNNDLAFNDLLIEMFPTERSDSNRRLFSTQYASGNDARTISSLRAADFLRPLAIGPRFDPSRIDPNLTANSTAFSPRNASLEDLEEAWLTLPEALALATGYYDAPSNRNPDNSPGDGSLDLSFGIGGIDSARASLDDEVIPLLDRGHLRVDAFLPFVNFNAPDVPAFDEPASSPPGPTDDLIVGLGIPLAANIPSMVRTVSRSQGDGPVALGSATGVIPGTININTAAIDVLRTIPLFSPPPNSVDPGNISLSNNASSGVYPIDTYWWEETANEAAHDVRSDIAATLLAYRDMIGVSTRRGGDLGNIEFDPDFLDFSIDPTNPELSGRRNTVGPGGLPITGSNAVRNTPGLLSTGEIFNLRATSVEQSLIGTNYIEPHSIDRLGLHPFLEAGIQPSPDINQPGVDNLRYGDLGANSTGRSDGIDAEHDQRLAIANAALASTSVRSDYYAVWFVLHGYQRADVEGLADDEPLVPSVRRRYLMIIDRSNVTLAGQRPRILDFRRVPE